MSDSRPEVVIVSTNHKGAVKRAQSDEYVEITNRGSSAADLSGWVLDVGGDFYWISDPVAGQDYTFPAGTVLAPGQTVRVYTNEVHAETGGFTFGSKRSIWSDKGGVARLRDRSGNLVSRLGYGDREGINAEPMKTGAATPRTDSDTTGGTGGGSPSPDGKNLTAKEAWDKVKAHWPGFEFMWQPGNTEEEIAAAEERLGVTLPERVRELMRECSGAAGGFPERDGHGYSADVCLLPVTQWRYLSNWEDERARQYIVIGSNDYMMDSGAHVLLHPGTGEVFSFDLNNEWLISMGSFEGWLDQHTLGKESYLAPPEVDELELEDRQTVAEAIARRHRGWVSSEREPAWKAVESKFIEAVNRLRGD